MAYITLKIDVDTYRGTREGVPNLVKLLSKHRAGATFLFSLGPDHTGWALKRVFRPGFFSKVSRTSVVEHYGLKTLMYGVLLPGPDIGKTCKNELRATQDAGFECGIHTWDHVLWHDEVRHKTADWTRWQMQKSHDRFTEVFGSAPLTHGAAGWQMNDAAFEQLDDWQMAYASDGRVLLRGQSMGQPHHLQINGNTLRHVQMPTTLPTLDELIGVDNITIDNVADHLLSLTQDSQKNQVYTLHAELEGQKLAHIFDKLLQGWRAQGHQLVSMGQYYQTLDLSRLPVMSYTWDAIPGRSGELIVQQA